MLNRPLRVASVLPYPLGLAGGQRYRSEQWFSLLPSSDLNVRHFPLFTERDYRRLYVAGRSAEKAARTAVALGRRLAQIQSAIKADVVYLYREAFPLFGPLVEKFLARRVPVVYDFDDAIWLGDTSYENAWVRHLKRPLKVGVSCSIAERTIVGNEYLADFAAEFAPNVTVIPTTVDVDRYRPGVAFNRKVSPIRVGWMGSPTTAPYLGGVEGALRQVLRDRSNVELVIAGAPEYRSLEDCRRVTVLPWSVASEIPILQSFDIGIMPMPDTPWTRGKCALKALLYMSVGSATIASPVGVNRDIIRDGWNGVLATSPSQWYEGLCRLIDDAAWRNALAVEGRRTVTNRFAGQRWAPCFLEQLALAAGSARV